MITSVVTVFLFVCKKYKKEEKLMMFNEILLCISCTTVGLLMGGICGFLIGFMHGYNPECEQ